ncbi:hypothetical protein [Actinoplanes sp. DH11]|uniref:hypothetical protein n=1 Tax=Actinoplanes sp. DH11 TaxID=2857011 RepID=UPI001E4138A6|nr:hypothetical protein [Actinoplanes sp. DH11]
MRRHSGWVAVVVMVAITAGCGRSEPPEVAPTATALSEAVPFVLRTHCGIVETKFDGRYYEAVPPLSDGQENPPPGWDNPEQSGTMQIISPTEAEFRDAAGHVVLFRVRPQATAFKRPCTD